MPNEDPNAGTAPEGGEAPTTPEAPAAGTTGTPAVPDEVTTLRSRQAGQDAKITSLQGQASAAEKARDEAVAKLQAYEAGKVGNDEALKSQLLVKEQELAEARNEALVAKLQASFPETHALFGAAIAGMTTDVLAASEARLKGAGFEESENPSPVGNNPVRAQAPATKTIEDMTLEELEKHLKSFDKSVIGL